MVQQKKIFAVENLAAKIKDAKACYLADYRGLSVGKTTELRQQVKTAGGEMEVVKNRLLKLALKTAGQTELAENEGLQLAGPTAALWAQTDEIAPLKALVKFAQDNELPKIKAGFMGPEFLSAAQVTELAKIPGLSQLKAKLVGSLAAPIYGLVWTLKGNLQKLAWALQAIAKQKENAN